MVDLTEPEKIALLLAYASPPARAQLTSTADEALDHRWNDRLTTLMALDADLCDTIRGLGFEMFVPTWYSPDTFDARELMASLWPVYAHLIEPTLRKLEDA